MAPIATATAKSNAVICEKLRGPMIRLHEINSR
jgi:hypothetical protein